MDETMFEPGSASEGRRRFLAAGAMGLAAATLPAEHAIGQAPRPTADALPAKIPDFTGPSAAPSGAYP